MIISEQIPTTSTLITMNIIISIILIPFSALMLRFSGYLLNEKIRYPKALIVATIVMIIDSFFINSKSLFDSLIISIIGIITVISLHIFLPLMIVNTLKEPKLKMGIIWYIFDCILSFLIGFPIMWLMIKQI